MFDAFVTFFLAQPLFLIGFLLSPFAFQILSLLIPQKNRKWLSRLLWLYFAWGFFFFLIMLNPGIFGFGQVKKIDEAFIHQNSLIAIDHLLSGDGEGSQWEYYRLHGMNLTDGKKNFRVLLGQNYLNIFGFNDQTVLIQMTPHTLCGYHITTGEKIFEITAQALEEAAPELKSGILDYSFNLPTGLLKVTTKNGLTYTVDPKTFSIVDANSFAGEPYQPYQNQLKEFSEQNSNFSDFSLTDDIRKKLTKSGRILNSELEFIDGQLLAIFPDLKIVTIISYDSTDHHTFTLSGLSFQGDLLWQLEENTDLKLITLSTPINPFTFAYNFNNHLIVLAGGYIISINAQNGKYEIQPL